MKSSNHVVEPALNIVVLIMVERPDFVVIFTGQVSIIVLITLMRIDVFCFLLNSECIIIVIDAVFVSVAGVNYIRENFLMLYCKSFTLIYHYSNHCQI